MPLRLYEVFSVYSRLIHQSDASAEVTQTATARFWCRHVQTCADATSQVMMPKLNLYAMIYNESCTHIRSPFALHHYLHAAQYTNNIQKKYGKEGQHEVFYCPLDLAAWRYYSE